MSFGPLISPETLLATAGSVLLLDARPGAEAYASGHLEGALHADLDRRLSSASDPGFDPARGGRHPLPAMEELDGRHGQAGIDELVAEGVRDGVVVPVELDVVVDIHIRTGGPTLPR